MMTANTAELIRSLFTESADFDTDRYVKNDLRIEKLDSWTNPVDAWTMATIWSKTGGKSGSKSGSSGTPQRGA